MLYNEMVEELIDLHLLLKLVLNSDASNRDYNSHIK